MVQFDPERNPIEVLADEFTARCRRGECPSITEYIEQYPELADEINELFPSIAMIEQLGRREEAERQLVKSQVALSGKQIDRLGDFRIIREIGRGGMGVVFEAQQQSLRRRVAVKVLTASLVSSPRQLKRFEREAKAAASLHHSNIVPVFGVGEQDGLHYYVMQFIEGLGLDVIISELRRWQSEDTKQDERSWNGGLAAAAARALCDGSFVSARSSFSSGSASVVDPAPTAVDISGSASDRTITDRQQETQQASAPPAAAESAECATTEHLASDGQQAASVATAASGDHPQQAARSNGIGRLGPHYWKSVATIGVQLADALQYAHSQGVLHRDIKPSNLLLDKYGTVWITDFGLAKDLHSENLTNPGDIVGTLKYMAPEQFEGQTGPLTDIYSLGVTLYELLTLQSPFEETKRSDLMRQVTHGQLRPPRKVNPRIPRDLETIVIKATACEPARRYQSAGELAADLQRFLEDRPILARPVSAVERMWRWCRRNPSLAASTSAAIICLLLFAAAMCTGYVRAKTLLARESAERQKAEATLGISLEALDKVYERFAPDRMALATQLTLEGAEGEDLEMPAQPVVSRETAALLEDILAFYDRFAEQNRNNAKLSEEAAKANRRVGDLYRRLGQYDQAEAAYRRAVRKYQELARQQPEATAFREAIAAVYNDLGIVFNEKREHGEARRVHQRALQILESEAKQAGCSPSIRYELARTCYLLGRSSWRSSRERPGRAGPARPRPEGSGPQRDQMGKIGPPRRFGMRGPSPRWGGPGLEYLERAIQLLQQLEKEHPRVPDYRHLLALCYRDSTGDLHSENMGKAIEILDQLTEEFPAIADFRHDLARTYADTKGFLFRPGLTAEDRMLMRQRLGIALEHCQTLLDEHPNVPRYMETTVQIYQKLAYLFSHELPEDAAARQAQLEQAESYYRQAIELQDGLVAQLPEAKGYVFWQTFLVRRLAGLLRDQDRLAEARVLLEQSIDRLKRRMDQDEQPSHLVTYALWESYKDLAEVLTLQGDQQRAAEASKLADQYRQRLRHRPFRRRGEGHRDED